jgi:hypothetical protein
MINPSPWTGENMTAGTGFSPQAHKGRKEMAKKAFVVLFGFVFVAVVTAQSNREVFNSWVGSHYTKLTGNFRGTVSYNGNSITFDTSWTETRARYVPSTGVVDASGRTLGNQRSSRTEYYQIRHERWVTFYFDQNGIITTWRSYGW